MIPSIRSILQLGGSDINKQWKHCKEYLKYKYLIKTMQGLDDTSCNELDIDNTSDNLSVAVLFFIILSYVNSLYQSFGFSNIRNY